MQPPLTLVIDRLDGPLQGVQVGRIRSGVTALPEEPEVEEPLLALLRQLVDARAGAVITLPHLGIHGLRSVI